MSQKSAVKYSPSLKIVLSNPKYEYKKLFRKEELA